MGSKPATYWDDVADEWSLSHPQRLWRRYSDMLNGQLLESWLPSGPVERALKTDAFDEAMGITGLLPQLAAVAKTVTAVDLSRTTLRRARQRHGSLQTIGADVLNLPFPDRSFDLIISNSTLDHMDSLDDVAQGLAEFNRVLQPGGQMILTLDNLQNPIVALRNALPAGLLRNIGLVPYQVGATCGPKRLGRLVEGAGFELQRMGAILHCPRVAAVWIADTMERRSDPETQEAFLRSLLKWERLASWPTRFLSGHFITVLATRPESPL